MAVWSKIMCQTTCTWFVVCKIRFMGYIQTQNHARRHWLHCETCL